MHYRPKPQGTDQMRVHLSLALAVSTALLLGLRTVQADQGHHHTHDHDGHMQSPAGGPGQASKVTRVIAVHALDQMRFEPSEFEVKSGQTVRFEVTNIGKVRHEFGIGTHDEQAAHAEMMLADPDMRHEDGRMITIEPGETKQLVWRFGKPGVYEVGCQIPGHYPAGMMARVVVSK